jgi:hypothetical protein
MNELGTACGGLNEQTEENLCSICGAVLAACFQMKDENDNASEGPPSLHGGIHYLARVVIPNPAFL